MPNPHITLRIINVIDDLWGVSYNKLARKYVAQYKTQGKTTYIGLFANPIDAAIAYDKTRYQAFKDGVILKESFVLNFGVPDSLEALHNIDKVREKLQPEILQNLQKINHCMQIVKKNPHIKLRNKTIGELVNTLVINSPGDFVGVSFYHKRQYYKASYQINKEKVFIGSFASPIDAAIAYDKEKYSFMQQHNLLGKRITLNFGIPGSPEANAKIEEVRSRLTPYLAEHIANYNLKHTQTMQAKKSNSTALNVLVNKNLHTIADLLGVKCCDDKIIASFSLNSKQFRLGEYSDPIAAAIAHDHAKYTAALNTNFIGQIRLNFGTPNSEEAIAKIDEARKLLAPQISALQSIATTTTTKTIITTTTTTTTTTQDTRKRKKRALQESPFKYNKKLLVTNDLPTASLPEVSTQDFTDILPQVTLEELDLLFMQDDAKVQQAMLLSSSGQPSPLLLCDNSVEEANLNGLLEYDWDLPIQEDVQTPSLVLFNNNAQEEKNLNELLDSDWDLLKQEEIRTPSPVLFSNTVKEETSLSALLDCDWDLPEQDNASMLATAAPKELLFSAPLIFAANKNNPLFDIDNYGVDEFLQQMSQAISTKINQSVKY